MATGGVNKEEKDCAAIGCSNSPTKNPELSFFLFPNPEKDNTEETRRRCHTWWTNTGRDDLDYRTDFQEIIKLKLCAEHFNADQFMLCLDESGNKITKTLHKDAVPTIFSTPRVAISGLPEEGYIEQEDGLKVYFSENCGESRKYKFRRIVTSTIHFRVKAPHNVAICLSPKSKEEPRNFYEILIGCWQSNNFSGIKVCKHRDLCKVETRDILSEEAYRGFWIRFQDTVIMVGKRGEICPFMAATVPQRIQNIAWYGFSTGYGAEGKWVFPDDDGRLSPTMSISDSESDLDPDEKTYHTEDCGEGRRYTYRRIKTRTINFQVRAPHDAALALSVDGKESTHDIFIGCWENGNFSGIRSKNFQIRVGTNDILSNDEFRGFWVRIKYGVITVGRKGEQDPFMAYTDPASLQKVTWYGFSTGWGAEGEWIFDDDDDDDEVCSSPTPMSTSESEDEDSNNIEDRPHPTKWEQWRGRLPLRPVSGGEGPKGEVYVGMIPHRGYALGPGMMPGILGGMMPGIRDGMMPGIPGGMMARIPGGMIQIQPRIFDHHLDFLRGPRFGGPRHQRFPGPFDTPSYVTGMVVPEDRRCYAPWGGQTLCGNQFYILTNPNSVVLSWEPSSNGRVPLGALKGGIDNGEELYIGRVHIDDVPIIGKIHPSHGSAYVSYEGTERGFSEYEVLCA